MKYIITYIFIIAASFAIYSCTSASPSKGKSEQECDTCDTGGYYEDEILNRIYYQYLRYPKDKDEMLVLYKKEILEMLTIHFSDPVTAKMAFEMSDSIRKNIPEDQELPEAYEYLFYYKGMEKDREYLEYIVEDECIIIRNHRLNKTEKNYKYDINKEVT